QLHRGGRRRNSCRGAASLTKSAPARNVGRQSPGECRIFRLGEIALAALRERRGAAYLERGILKSANRPRGTQYAAGELSISNARKAAAPRVSVPSFAKISRTCFLTVDSLLPRMVAISLLVLPCASQSNVSATRGVRPS